MDNLHIQKKRKVSANGEQPSFEEIFKSLKKESMALAFEIRPLIYENHKKPNLLLTSEDILKKISGFNTAIIMLNNSISDMKSVIDTASQAEAVLTGEQKRDLSLFRDKQKIYSDFLKDLTEQKDILQAWNENIQSRIAPNTTMLIKDITIKAEKAVEEYYNYGSVAHSDDTSAPELENYKELLAQILSIGHSAKLREIKYDLLHIIQKLTKKTRGELDPSVLSFYHRHDDRQASNDLGINTHQVHRPVRIHGAMTDYMRIIDSKFARYVASTVKKHHELSLLIREIERYIVIIPGKPEYVSNLKDIDAAKLLLDDLMKSANEIMEVSASLYNGLSESEKIVFDKNKALVNKEKELYASYKRLLVERSEYLQTNNQNYQVRREVKQPPQCKTETDVLMKKFENFLNNSSGNPAQDVLPELNEFEKLHADISAMMKVQRNKFDSLGAAFMMIAHHPDNKRFSISLDELPYQDGFVAERSALFNHQEGVVVNHNVNQNMAIVVPSQQLPAVSSVSITRPSLMQNDNLSSDDLKTCYQILHKHVLSVIRKRNTFDRNLKTIDANPAYFIKPEHLAKNLEQHDLAIKKANVLMQLVLTTQRLIEAKMPLLTDQEKTFVEQQIELLQKEYSLYSQYHLKLVTRKTEYKVKFDKRQQRVAFLMSAQNSITLRDLDHQAATLLRPQENTITILDPTFLDSLEQLVIDYSVISHQYPETQPMYRLHILQTLKKHPLQIAKNITLKELPFNQEDVALLERLLGLSHDHEELPAQPISED